ncbi:MAG TPA: condensation domain-containing protein, partial [Ktedonobacteraceae bacterium]|nr:condensation domain-containing protein [Ktedonobacteraceae bacterium]
PVADQWLELLEHIWAFDHLHLTQEDRSRTELYQQNRVRAQLQQEAPTLKEFLAALELEVQIYPITEGQIARVAQLTQRTNQFNCTTQRYSASEVTQYLSKPGQEGVVVEVRDRFGDYGKVGVMLFTLRDKALTVDIFLMSCRSMGRGVEHRMLASLGIYAQERGIERVVVPYLPTGKNRPALDFLEQVGGAYKQAEANGALRFDLPAASLIDLSYNPSDERSTSSEEDEIIRQANNVTPREMEALTEASAHSVIQLTPSHSLRIAHELSSAEQVLQALERQKRQPAHSMGQFVVPTTNTEKVLVEIWQQLLHLERVGINDNFFTLGGHSLLATQLLSRMATAFDVRLPLQAIFERPAIVQLARQIDDVLQSGEMGMEALSAIQRVARDGALPLSFAQQRLWFLNQIAPDNPSYNIPLRIRLQGTLDNKALQLSLQEIIQRHEVLRTTFPANGDDVGQVIAPMLALRLPVVDLELLSEGERERVSQQLLSENWQRSFSLEGGPLLRMLLLRANPEDAILAITFHHIVFDAWSAGVLSNELIMLYGAFRDRMPSPLTPLPIQYADFACWQREWLKDKALQRLEHYWRERLRGMTTLQLPGERPATPRHSFQGGSVPFTLSSELSRELLALSQQESATLFMTVLAAFQTLLYRSTGQTDIVIGTDIANRTRSEVEHLIGFFVNLLVLRTDLSNQPTFRELLHRVREDVLGAYAHQDLPFEKVVDIVQPDRKLNHAPLVRVLFVLQNTPLVPITLPGLTISPVETVVDTVNFDLVVFLYEEPQEVKGVMHYSTDIFDTEAIERLVEHFLRLLNDVIAHPEASVDTLAIYSEAEKERLILEETARREGRRQKLKLSRRKN